MKETYCIKDRRKTPCVGPSGYQEDKNGRTQFFCYCGVCGIKKVRYVKMGGVPPKTPMITGSGKTKKSKTKKKSKN